MIVWNHAWFQQENRLGDESGTFITGRRITISWIQEWFCCLCSLSNNWIQYYEFTGILLSKCLENKEKQVTEHKIHQIKQLCCVHQMWLGQTTESFMFLHRSRYMVFWINFLRQSSLFCLPLPTLISLQCSPVFLFSSHDQTTQCSPLFLFSLHDQGALPFPYCCVWCSTFMTLVQMFASNSGPHIGNHTPLPPSSSSFVEHLKFHCSRGQTMHSSAHFLTSNESELL